MITDHLGVDRFLATGPSATISGRDAWSADASLDTTVPFRVRAVGPIRSKYAKWFADPGVFEQVRRLATDDGEVVGYTFTWTEEPVPHAGHPVPILTVRGGFIVAGTVRCGRWPPGLLAELEAADV